jgi:hypothetical protein
MADEVKENSEGEHGKPEDELGPELRAKHDEHVKFIERNLSLDMGLEDALRRADAERGESTTRPTTHTEREEPDRDVEPTTEEASQGNGK